MRATIAGQQKRQAVDPIIRRKVQGEYWLTSKTYYMRIIRIVVILLATFAVIFPQLAFADETINTETNTDPTLSYFYNLLAPDVAQADEAILAAAPKNEAQQDPAENETEEILATWKEKQADKWASLPRQPFAIDASAYTAAADECGNNLGVTASGTKVAANRTIACPPEFPFGAKIKIEGQGTFICEDRGGAIKGNHIDIYVETKKEAFAFGRQNLMAEVVE